jgi:hypothetical protein
LVLVLEAMFKTQSIVDAMDAELTLKAVEALERVLGICLVSQDQISDEVSASILRAYENLFEVSENMQITNLDTAKKLLQLLTDASSDVSNLDDVRVAAIDALSSLLSHISRSDTAKGEEFFKHQLNSIIALVEHLLSTSEQKIVLITIKVCPFFTFLIL